ncbi:MAG: cation transporter [Halanaerobiales bacterium]|nr:cation transporter [Halanaerobiales bacterium]
MNLKEREKIANHALVTTIYGNVILTIIKAIAGIISGSTAMVSDAVHSLSDVLSTIVAMVGVKISSKPADEDHHYGHGRAETVATKILAMLIMITGLGIGWAGLKGLLNGAFTKPGVSALWAAFLSIGVKEWMYRFTRKKGEEIKSNVLIADAHHHRSDALSSITALIGIAGGRLGYPILDPIAGIAVAVLIIKTGLVLYWQAIQELVDQAPKPEILKEIARTTVDTKGVINVYDIKARTYGSQVYVDLTICVNRFISVYEGHEIAHSTVDHIKKHLPEVKDVLVHVNPCTQVKDGDDSQSGCNECNTLPRRELLLGHDDLEQVSVNQKENL